MTLHSAYRAGKVSAFRTRSVHCAGSEPTDGSTRFRRLRSIKLSHRSMLVLEVLDVFEYLRLVTFSMHEEPIDEA